MPKKIQKTLQDYLSKIKTHHRKQIKLPFNSLSSSKKWVLSVSGCKHPKTPSFALEDGRNVETHGGGSSSNNSNSNSSSKNQIHNDGAAATLADVDRFLLENFKSLYLKDDEEQTKNNKNTKRVLEKNHEDDDDDDDEAPKSGPILFDNSPRRFFVKKGFSGSLLEDAMTTCDDDHEAGSSSNSTTTTLNDSSLMNSKDKALPENCIALLSYSPSPYEDFRRSMQDMAEARSSDIDWEFMEELLFCYLNLNEKKSHKFILSAFVDLITAMRSQNSELALAKPRSVRTVRIDSEGKKKKKKTTTKGVTLELI